LVVEEEPYMPRYEKVKYISLMLISYISLYIFIQAAVTTHQVDFITEFDLAIPFMPQHIWIYHSILPVIFLTMLSLVQTRTLFITTFWACAFATLVLNISYLCFPSFYPRADFEVNTISEAFLYLTRKIDASHNTFPSGHVTFAWIMFLGAIKTKLANRVEGIKALYLLWALGIALSTLTLKQHYLVDVISGITLAYLSFYASRLFVRERLTLQV
jgi:membrane-associated phospholipid phosphatase